MIRGADLCPLIFGCCRRGAALAPASVATAAACVLVSPALAATPAEAPAQQLVIVTKDHLARREPSAHAGRIEAVDSRRPLTGTRTVLPVLGQAISATGGVWLRVRLPGRPNGHAGWIAANHTKLSSSPWLIRVALSSRRVTVYRGGHLKRRFPAVVGKRSTPTPRGQFFIEEALALAPDAAGGPFALATSARSRALHEFDGGPGQIALHGTNNLTGRPGTAVSHGCIRLNTNAITWLARRIGSGVPLTITR